jgi:glycosyltransferase involved in cell wall biosynthesis
MRRLRIVFDPWVLAPRFQHHGTNIYARNLLKHLLKAAADSDVEFCMPCPAEAFGDGVPVEKLVFVGSAFKRHDRFWRLGGATLDARKISADLIFSPSCNAIPFSQPPMVCTIHDVTPFTVPSQSRRVVLTQRFFIRFAARRSVAIITVSERSRQDIVERCGVAGDKIAVVYNGYDREVFNTVPADPEEQNALRQRLGICRPYLFHHGVIQPRKNLKRLIQAHRLLLSRRGDMELDLVLAGPLGWRYNEVLRELAEDHGDRGRVILVGALNDQELALLLKGATVAVMPSLYEGFCLPMIEAMACGIPTVASNNSCMPEVSGNKLVYFDPLSVDEITAAIESVLVSAELRQNVVAGSLDRVREFGWERCARETLGVLLRAANHETRELAGASA